MKYSNTTFVYPSGKRTAPQERTKRARDAHQKGRTKGENSTPRKHHKGESNTPKKQHRSENSGPRKDESARAAHEGGRNLPPEASARASLQKLWEATGAELLFAARLTGQQAEDGRPRPDFSVHLRWQLPKPFPAVTFDDKPLLLHPSLQHLLPTLEASDAQATGCRLHAPQRTPGGRLVPGRVLSAVLFLLVCSKSKFRKIWLLTTCGRHCQFGQMPVSLTDARQEARANN